MTPAMAKDVTIEKGETVILKNYWKNEVSLMYDAKEKETDADKTSSPSGNHITIYGNVTLDVPCSDLRARLLSLPCISSQICTRTAC